MLSFSPVGLCPSSQSPIPVSSQSDPVPVDSEYSSAPHSTNQSCQSPAYAILSGVHFSRPCFLLLATWRALRTLGILFFFFPVPAFPVLPVPPLLLSPSCPVLPSSSSPAATTEFRLYLVFIPRRLFDDSHRLSAIATRHSFLNQFSFFFPTLISALSHCRAYHRGQLRRYPVTLRYLTPAAHLVALTVPTSTFRFDFHLAIFPLPSFAS